jgi:hypothetical protein
MRFRDFRVSSFPRSGTHYLLKVLGDNFWPGASKYWKRFTIHALQFAEEEDRTLAIFYISRNFESVARSCFRLRKFWRFDEDDYGRFLERPLREMYNPELPGIAYRDGVRHRQGGRPRFSQHTNTLYELWQAHNLTWARKRLPNLFIVFYEDLISNFVGTMTEIAEFLGSSRRTFADVPEHVGWRIEPPDEVGKGGGGGGPKK